MTDRESIVWRPNIERQDPTKPAAVRARQERLARNAPKKRGIRRFLARRALAKRARNFLARRLEASAARRLLASEGRAVTGAGRAAAGGGAVVVGVIVAAIIALRLISGRSFGNMQANVKKILLGDASEAARARLETVGRLGRDPNLMLFIHRHGYTPDVREMVDGIVAMREEDLKGETLFETDKRFQVNSLLDIVIVEGAKAAQKAAKRAAGDPELKSLVQRAKGLLKGSPR